MFKLNQRGAAMSGVFYGMLLLFLFLVLSIVIVLGNGRKALNTAKENAINELNSKSILIEGVVLDYDNTDDGSYVTNSVNKNLLDITVKLKEENITSDTKTTVLVTIYNSTKNNYIFKGIKYDNFSNTDIKEYPELENYVNNSNITIDQTSYSSHMNAVVRPYSTITIPITYKYGDINNVYENSIDSYIIFNFQK